MDSDIDAAARFKDLQRRARLRANNAPWYPDHDEGAFDRWLAANDPGDVFPVMTADEWCDALEAGTCPGIVIMIVG